MTDPMTGQLHPMPVLSLPAGERSPRLAREFVASWLAAWRCEEVGDRAVLATSELVTNAVVHAGTPVRVEMTKEGDHLWIGVVDEQSDLPAAPRSMEPSAIHGRGLAIVGAVADGWGVDPEKDGGKAVWCILECSA